MRKGKLKDELTGVNFMESFVNDSSLRSKVFEKLKAHLLLGNSLGCFELMSEETIREAMKTYPVEWSVEELEKTIRKAQAGWENIGRRQAEGTCLGNSRSWFYNMSNRYGWSDKQKVETSGSQAVNVTIVDYSSSKQAPGTT